MCGRYQFADNQDIEEINKIIQEINNKYNGMDVAAKIGEIYPTNIAPILSLIDEKPAISLMPWGFPKWDNKGVIINAKAETAAEKNMFAKPLIEKRCVILSTGFYEWKQKTKGKEKDKYLFLSGDSSMLYMAGFYNIFNTGGQLQERFVILTREANRYINDVHNRMPVILHKNELIFWLRNDSFTSFAFKRDDIVLERKFAG